MGGALEPQCMGHSALGDDDDSSIASRYQLHLMPKRLGQGQFSKAYACWRRDEPETCYALKEFLTEHDAIEHALNEAMVLRALGPHPRIIQLIESEVQVPEEKRPLRVVLELCEGGQLFDRLTEKGRYEESEGAQVVKQLLEAADFMHGRGVMHRDLKLENVLLISHDSDVDVKVCDFGIAKMAEPAPCQESVTPEAVMPLVMRRGVPRSSSFKGSNYYLSPEMIRQEEYGPEIDIWAIGVMAFGLLSGSLPFSCKDDDLRELYHKIIHCNLSFAGEAWEEKSSACVEFIQTLLTVDPDRRPTALTALQHPWLKQEDVCEFNEDEDDNEGDGEAEDFGFTCYARGYARSPSARGDTSVAVAKTPAH